jgi:hypothetical protein
LTLEEAKPLRDAALWAGDENSFKLKSMQIRALSGVPIVLLEGTFKSSGLGLLAMVIDSDGKGHPEFLTSQAPEDPSAKDSYSPENLYSLYRPVAIEAFKSVKWAPGYAEQFVRTAKPKDENGDE